MKPDATQFSSPPVMSSVIELPLTPPRWKMMDVVWLTHYWRPRGLIVGIIRDKDNPNKIRYDIVNEWEVSNCFSADECVSEDEWRKEMERYLRDEYSPREWRAKLAVVDAFQEPPCWEAFRQRWRETGDPYLPWPDGSRPSWQIDQTIPSV